MAIVKDLKDNYIRTHGLSLVVDEFNPPKRMGSKEERMMSILEPKYANRQIWHYMSGNCQILEEELIFRNPQHDDCMDSLASALDFAIAPMNMYQMKKDNASNFNFHSRWGGVV